MNISCTSWTHTFSFLKITWFICVHKAQITCKPDHLACFLSTSPSKGLAVDNWERFPLKSKGRYTLKKLILRPGHNSNHLRIPLPMIKVSSANCGWEISNLSFPTMKHSNIFIWTSWSIRPPNPCATMRN